MYTIKNLKTWSGMDGYGYSATIYCDGKEVGTILQEGSGAPDFYRWNSKEEEKIANEFAKSLPEDEYGTFEKLDTYFAKLCDDFENTKRMKSLLKKKTLFRLKDETYENGEWRTVEMPFSEKVHAYLDKKYGDRLGEISGVIKEVTE
jgi:hypothetical protein